MKGAPRKPGHLVALMEMEFNTVRDLLPVDLGAGVTLQTVPDWVRTVSVDYLREADREHVKKFATYCLVARCIDDDSDLNAFPEKTHEVIALASQALWLTKPGPVTYHLLISVVGDPSDPGWRVVARVSGLECWPFQRTAVYSRTEFDEARTMNSGVVGLDSGPVWQARSVLNYALRSDSWNVRFLLVWTALEALFAPPEGGSATHQLAERMAFFLSETPAEAEATYTRVKAAYRLRSTLVHGRTSKPAVGNSDMAVESEEWVRRSLVHILKSPDLLAAFTTAGRDAYLRRLAFVGPRLARVSE